MTEARLGGTGRVSGFWAGADSVLDFSTWPRRAAWFIAATTVLRLIIIASTGLSDTESYYLFWSRFPALSYYDHPPLMAWMAALTTLASRSAFSARLGAVICSAWLGVLVYRFAARLFAPRAGFIAVVVVTIPPVFFFTGFLINPESPLAPLWALSLLLLDDLRHHDEPWRPLRLGLVIGVAFLAKFTAILLVPITLLAVVSSRQTRRWLRRPSFYAAGLVALAAASPVIVWNYQHGWPSVTLHMIERMAPAAGSAVSVRVARTVLAQFVLMQPLVLPGILAILAVAIHRARTDARYRLLAIASGPVLLFFFVLMVRVSDAEPHWTMVGYLPLAVASGGFIDERLGHASQKTRAPYGLVAYMRAAIAVSAAFVVLYFVHAQSPVVMRLVPRGVYDASLDPINETFGWNRVVAAIEDEAAKLGPETVVAASHNVLCGQVAVQTDDRPPLYCPSPRRTQFDFLGRRDPPQGAPVVYVDSVRYHEDVARVLPGWRCERRQSIVIVRDGRELNQYRIYTCLPLEQ